MTFTLHFPLSLIPFGLSVSLSLSPLLFSIFLIIGSVIGRFRGDNSARNKKPVLISYHLNPAVARISPFEIDFL